MPTNDQAVHAALARNFQKFEALGTALKSASRAGLLEPDVLAALGLSDHPVVAVARGAPN